MLIQRKKNKVSLLFLFKYIGSATTRCIFLMYSWTYNEFFGVIQLNFLSYSFKDHPVIDLLVYIQANKLKSAIYASFNLYNSLLFSISGPQTNLLLYFLYWLNISNFALLNRS